MIFLEFSIKLSEFEIIEFFIYNSGKCIDCYIAKINNNSYISKYYNSYYLTNCNPFVYKDKDGRSYLGFDEVISEIKKNYIKGLL